LTLPAHRARGFPSSRKNYYHAWHVKTGAFGHLATARSRSAENPRIDGIGDHRWTSAKSPDKISIRTPHLEADLAIWHHDSYGTST